jgi:small-conductance mechanosensitive channel
LGFIVFAAVVLVFVVIQQQTGMGPALAGVGTFLISAAFALGPTIQEILGSCIFLFLKHPFDVGDRVDITGKKYIVEKISLLYTIFKCVDDQKVTQAPNNVLNTLWIENISRSKLMTETIAINVSYDTSLEDIQKLEEDLLIFIQENSRDFQQDLNVQVAGINDLDKMTIKLDIKHKSNWSNGLLALQRRNKFFCALVLIMKKIPIYGAGGGCAVIGEEGKPMYTVAITDDKAQENMENQTKSKLSKRWDAKKEEQEARELREPMDEAAKDKETDTSPVVDPVLLSVLGPRLGRAESRSENVGGLMKKESTKGRRKRSVSPSSTQGHSQSQPQQ